VNNLYIDIDDVVAATSKKIPEIVSAQLGKPAAYDDMTTFNLKTAFKLNDNQYNKLMFHLHTDDIINELEVVEHAAGSIMQLKKSGFNIELITGRPPEVYESTITWLKNHHIYFDHLYFFDKYNRYKSGVKHDHLIDQSVFSTMTFRFAIEDSFDMACKLAETGTDVALFNRPWNQGEDIYHKGKNTIYRCHNWKDIYELITKKAVINSLSN